MENRVGSCTVLHDWQQIIVPLAFFLHSFFEGFGTLVRKDTLARIITPCVKECTSKSRESLTAIRFLTVNIAVMYPQVKVVGVNIA